MSALEAGDLATHDLFKGSFLYVGIVVNGDDTVAPLGPNHVFLHYADETRPTLVFWTSTLANFVKVSEKEGVL